MDYILVTQVEKLEQICQKMQKKSVVMLDTEFVRTRTLYPKLGLVQLFDGEDLVLIDPIKIQDLSALWALMKDQSVLKVLHACSEDLEVFQHAAGLMPSPIIDTQIMAAFLGHGLSTGFAALVNQYLDVSLDKGEARTDWCARPLTQNQLTYAAADVFYLLPLYEILNDKIKQQGWEDEITQESERCVRKRSKKAEPEAAYLEIKNAWQLKPKQLAALQKLASWRLSEAKKRDLALNFVVKDLHLWKMAKYNIRSLDKMATEGFDRFEIERHGHRMIRIMAEVEQLAISQYPDQIERLVDRDGYKQAVKLIKEQVDHVATTLKLAPEFIGSKKQIHQVLKWHWEQEQAPELIPEMLTGWRGKHLSSHLQPLLKQL